MSAVEARLNEMGLTIPSPVAPVATYVPFVKSQGLLHISGQISVGPDGLVTGRVGKDVSLAEAQAAARLCALNLLAQMKVALDGEFERVKQVVKLGGFVNADPDFYDIPKVINGASDLFGAVLGDAGRHARSAVGVAVLPLNAAVEIDAIVEIG